VSYQPGLARVVVVDKQLQHRDEFLAEIREHLLLAQDIMKTSYNKLHHDLEFNVGEWVWLRLHQRSAAGITTSTKTKLAPRFYGSFHIVERVGAVAYCPCLPPKARIHDVFHVAFLKKHYGDPPTSMVALPPIANGCGATRSFQGGQSYSN
jgi:hypothetical protein